MENPTEVLAKNTDDVVKRRRQRLPKVRTGCKICKARRVKCDERKPGCLRCEKSGWDCNGYPQKPPQSRPILPRLDPNFSPIFFQPRININRDENEARYFRYFSENIAHEIAGFFDWELWTRLFPQACQSDDSLRHVIIAIAASRIADKDPINPHNSTGNTHWHRQSALRHYSKAIKAMKDSSIKGNQDPRSIMLNCIILLCFETMHYHQASGIQQAIIITKMIDANFVQNGQLTDAALNRQVSPGSGNELFEILDGLDTCTRLCLNTQTARKSVLLKRYGERKVTSMPSHFHSLQEARSWLTLICVRLNHFLDSITLDHPSVEYFLPDTMVCVPDGLEKEQEEYVNEHLRWKEAFDSFVACGPTFSDRELLGVRQLELHYLTSYFSGAVARRANEPWPKTRNFMAVFTRMVEISRSILEVSKGKGEYLFVFGMQVVCPLTVVAWRCPGRRIRREAIDLLRLYPRREGLLTGFINAELIEKLMLAEEQNCGDTGEYIPDEMRCTSVSLNVSTAEANRHTLIQCRLPTKIPGVWVTTNNKVCW